MGRPRMVWFRWLQWLGQACRQRPRQQPPRRLVKSETTAGETMWRVRFMANQRILEEHFFPTYTAATTWLTETRPADWAGHLVNLIGPADQLPSLYPPEPEESA